MIGSKAADNKILKLFTSEFENDNKIEGGLKDLDSKYKEKFYDDGNLSKNKIYLAELFFKLGF